MCYICSALPDSDPLSRFDMHDGAFVPTSGSGTIPGMTGTGFGGPDITSAPYTWDQIAGYLTDGYWGLNSGAWRAFTLDASRTITYDLSRLSAAAAAIAEYSLDVWAAATGINFVNLTPLVVLVGEPTDAGNTMGTARAIGANTIVTASVGVSYDVDFYSVTMTAGQTYLISLSRTAGSTLDPVLSLYDASGNRITLQDDPYNVAAGEYITFTAVTTGTYYVRAEDYYSYTGGYELSVQPAADLTFGDGDATGAYAWSEISANEILRSFINVHDSWSDLNLNGYMLQTYMHEIGHALGLGHAGDYNGSAVWGTDNDYDNDSWSATIMSYFDQGDNPFDPSDHAYLATIMPADLIAIQNLYGMGAGYEAGNTVWGPGGNHSGTYFQMLLNIWGGVIPANPLVYAGNSFAFMVYDTGGIDTLNFSAFAQNQNINLNHLVRSDIGGVIGNVVIARDTVIENAVGGSGDDTLSGNSTHNLLDGGAGNDRLIASGGGNDTLRGGLGTDLAVLSVASTAITVNGSAENLRIVFAGGSIMASGVESFQFTDQTLTLAQLVARAVPTGPTTGNDVLTGTEGNDVIDALAGNDFVEGLGGNDVLVGRAGNDTLYGGEGDDTLFGGLGADALYGGFGSDMAHYSDATGGLRADLETSATNTGFAAGDTYDNIENLAGSNYNDVLLGNSLGNALWGLNGNDQLWGRGGDDHLIAGAGDDTLIGGAGADRLDGGAGRDRVVYVDSAVGLRADLQVWASNTGIAAGDVYIAVEDLYGTGYNDVLLGNTVANTIWGDSGNDQIWGRAGNDTLIGGNGNDTLLGGAGADLLNGGEGRDRVQYNDSATGLRADLQVASTNTGIAAGDSYVSIEDLYGTLSNDVLLGDAAGNIIWGDGGNDQIWGRAGNDTLIGGNGNDTLLGGAGADLLNGGEGRDRVQYNDSATGLRADLQIASTNTGIAAGDTYASIEDLYGSAGNDLLLGDAAGNVIWGDSGNDLLWGRLGNDTLYGGNGNDRLYGGAGADFLMGGAGTDTFIFDTALGGGNVDTIHDFSVVDDMIWLDDAVFAALAPGFLAANAFALGAAATTAQHRIIYNQANGHLIYDSNGSAAGGAVHFATLTAGLALSAAEFLIV